MTLAAVCLAATAVTLVRCQQLAQDPIAPLQVRHLDHIRTEEWKTRGKPPMETTFSRTTPADTNSTDEFFKNFARFKNIYNECKTKINKRLRHLIKVHSRLPEAKTYLLWLYQCVKVYGLRALDQVLEEDFIPLTDYACFVRDRLNGTSPRAAFEGPPVPLKDYAARVLAQDWTALAYDRLEALLRSYSLRLHFHGGVTPQGRSRRRDHRMFAMMVMGFMIMASILIPMGFQFLTVLGGKSLLLAKMALIMSAISGLKKIATSNVGYGFYHTGSDGHHHDHIHHGFHEKHYQTNSANYNGLQGYN